MKKNQIFTPPPRIFSINIHLPVTLFNRFSAYLHLCR